MKYIKISAFIIFCLLLSCGFELGCILSHDNHFSNDQLLTDIQTIEAK